MCSVRTELYDTYIYRKIRIQIDLYRIPLKHDYTFEKKNIANNFLIYTENMIYFQV